VVLLRGESGVGKEIFAELIHRLSGRSRKPFIKVNCAALPESLLESELFGYVRGAFTGADRNRDGLFQVANGGTLLLDEIGEISPTFQPKLLRVLQDGTFHRIGESRNPRTVDVRVIAATNRDLEEAIEKGAFRRDLFYRLSVIPLHIPPLRDHIEDLPELIEYFVTKLGKDRKIQFNKASMESFVNYWWPGNVRELASAIEYAMVLGESDVIEPEDLPVAIQDHQRLAGRTIQSGLAGEESLEAIEKRCILQAMVRTNANQKSAADILGITRRKLGYRIAKYGLEREIAEIQYQAGTGPATPRRQMAKVRGASTPSSRVGTSPKGDC
jgi:transcriptional regulator with PAS, ATPase and Fis domain